MVNRPHPLKLQFSYSSPIIAEPFLPKLEALARCLTRSTVVTTHTHTLTHTQPGTAWASTRWWNENQLPSIGRPPQPHTLVVFLQQELWHTSQTTFERKYTPNTHTHAHTRTHTFRISLAQNTSVLRLFLNESLTQTRGEKGVLREEGMIQYPQGPINCIYISYFCNTFHLIFLPNFVTLSSLKTQHSIAYS